MKPNIKDIEDNLDNFRAVQYRMGNEGMDYCFEQYSSFDEIEDEEEKCPNGTVSNIARCSLVMCFSVFCVCTLCELISFLTCNRIFCRVICSILTNCMKIENLIYLNLSFLGRFYSLIYLNFFAKNLLYVET